MLVVHFRRLPLSKAQLYDTWVQHGSADPQSPVFARSANGIISCAPHVTSISIQQCCAWCSLLCGVWHGTTSVCKLDTPGCLH